MERAGGQRELSRRAGLKDERHIGVILGRLRKNPAAEIERDTLVLIAAGGGVSVDWLAKDPASHAEATPSSTDSSVPHLANAIGFDDALAEARRREPKIRAHAWEAVARSSKYILRGRVQPEDIIKLARVAEELADPARTEALVIEQQQQLVALREEMERERLEKATKKPAKKGGR